MNAITNIWKHPRTSTAGVLISVATVAGVLAQQGVSLGSIGGGTVVSLAGALATALLGLMSRDPGTPAAEPVPATGCEGDCSDNGSGKSISNAKLSVWLLIVLLLPLPWLEGCNANQVAKDIVRWTPPLQSAIATIDSTAALLAPGDAPVFSAATAGFDAASNVLVVQAQAYLAHPSASTLRQLQNQIVTLQQQVNAALLQSAHIVNAASQQHAITAIQAVATITTAILALVQSVSSRTEIAQMAAHSQIKLAAVAPFLSTDQSALVIAQHYNEPIAAARQQITQSEQFASRAGL